MFEFECVGVEGNSVYNRFLHSGFGIFQLPGIDEFSAIHIIGDDGVFNIREMDTELVSSAGPW